MIEYLSIRYYDIWNFQTVQQKEIVCVYVRERERAEERQRERKRKSKCGKIFAISGSRCRRYKDIILSTSL